MKKEWELTQVFGMLLINIYVIKIYLGTSILLPNYQFALISEIPLN